MNTNQNHDAQISQVASFFQSANDVLVITGAGISADSGLPTYRGVGGLYDGNVTEDGMTIEKALSGPMFRSRPEITWKYLAEIERGARGAKPNRGHEVLAEMEKQFQRFWILTQNIDGFHLAAGSQNVIEIHGNMHQMKCTECTYRQHYDDYSDFQIPPFCPECQSMVRPDVVLFEEQLPTVAIETLMRESQTLFDLVVSIGTSSHFPYIIEPVLLAQRMGIATVEINPGQTMLSDVVDVHLRLGAAKALDSIWNRYR